MSWRSLNNPSTGLTLIEMLVVIAIFAIITVVVLADLPSLKNRLSLDLLAEEVAVAIRQTQVYGAATRVFGSEFPSHGVYLPVVGDSFILFADLDSDNKYDGPFDPLGGCIEECREQFKLHGGVKINRIFICEDSGCYSAQKDATIINKVVVLFKRPGLDAYFYDVDEGVNVSASYIKIELYSEKSGESRGIAIWHTGHIYTCRDFDKC